MPVLAAITLDITSVSIGSHCTRHHYIVPVLAVITLDITSASIGSHYISKTVFWLAAIVMETYVNADKLSSKYFVGIYEQQYIGLFLSQHHSKFGLVIHPLWLFILNKGCLQQEIFSQQGTIWYFGGDRHEKQHFKWILTRVNPSPSSVCLVWPWNLLSIPLI